MEMLNSHAEAAATYLLIVRPKVTWTSAIRVFLTHLNTAVDKSTVETVRSKEHMLTQSCSKYVCMRKRVHSLPLSSKISPISMKQGSARASLLPSPSSP